MKLLHFMLALICVPAVSSAADISTKRLKGHVRILASDRFHGRGPAQIGEKPTLVSIAPLRVRSEGGSNAFSP